MEILSPSAPMVVAAIAGVFLGTLLWILIRGYRSEGERAYTPEQWYTETVAHCDEALDVLDAFESDRRLSHDETRAAMGAVVRNMSTHAGKTVDTDVDEDAFSELRSAAIACRDLHEAHIEIGDASEWDRAIDRARDTVQSAKASAETHLDTRR